MNTRKLTEWTLAGLLTASAITAQAQSWLQPKAFSDKAQYMVIDLSGGPDAAKYPVTYEANPPDLDFDSCRTKEIWLRLIPAGKFMMGSPADELGREGSEDLHQVTLTQPFYIGVFEVTQKQYELVMGANPSKYKGDTRPVERVSYHDLRGKEKGNQWPKNNDVDADSFFGKLRAKTGLLADLPTEAQWEYACRAGTKTALNSGKNLTVSSGFCPNLAELGRYANNRSDGKGNFSEHTKVGMYKPNAWGLYDMLGNVWEWCLDGRGDYGTAAVTNPRGSSQRAYGDMVTRGGCWQDAAGRSRSARRGLTYSNPNMVSEYRGFRMVVLPGATQVKPVSPAMQRQPDQPSVTPSTAETPKEVVTLEEAEEELAATCAEFKAVWDVYKTNTEKINAEFQPKAEALYQQYGKALETLKGNVQRRGDLEKAKAVIAEMERFEAAKVLPSAPDEEAIAEIKALQASTIRPLAALEKDRLSRMATLTRRYGQALEQLKADLTRAGKFDDATAVSEARERAKRAE